MKFTPFKRKPTLKLPAPKSDEFLHGTVERPMSYISVVPKDLRVMSDTEALMQKILEFEEIEVVSRTQRDGGFSVCLNYNGEEFDFEVLIMPFELSPFMRISHDFTEEEIAVMESADRIVASRMTFGENNCESYLLQIKLLCAMVPDPAGIVDNSAERMLSGRWSRLAAKSDVPPSPEYLFTIQAVSGDENDVWLHTHGLNRCGGIELEILGANTENCNDFAHVINSLGSRISSRGEFADEYEPIYAAELSNGEPLVASWISWKKAVEYYPAAMLGGKNERADDEVHSGQSGVVYVYANPDDCEKKILSHISVLENELSDNPMLMITTEETQRMKRLAAERLPYLRQLFDMYGSDEEAAVLVKIGLEPDPEFRDGDKKEHIWFEVKEMHDNHLVGELTQEAYYVKDIKPGDIMQCSFDQITDWVVMTKDVRFTPDTVYRLIK